MSRTIADRAVFGLAVGFLGLLTSAVSADESPMGIACRTVHLGFDAPAGSAFYNEVTIEKAAPRSFFPFDWQAGETCRCLLTGRVDGPRTEYTGFLYLPKEGARRRLVTFSAPNGGKPLRGYYSFLEDFRRNRISATQIREARFGNGWVRNVDGDSLAIRRARFTADAKPVLNIDAGLRQTSFFLATRGETVNDGAKLKDWIDSKVSPDERKPPADLPEIPR